MKHIYYIVAAAAVLVLAACNKETPASVDNEQISKGTYTYTLNASVDSDLTLEDGTKTAYAGDKTFSWTKGDQISVLFHNGDDNQFFTFTAVKGGSPSAKFVGEVTEGYTIGSSDAGYNSQTKWALYPASASHVYTAGATYPISFHIPAEIDLSNTPSANLPMTGCGDANDNFTFTTATACYKFTFTGLSSVSKVSLTVENISNGYYLSGDSSIRLNGSDYYLNMYEGSGVKTVTIIEDVSSGTATFYVPVRGWNDEMKANITLKNMDAGTNNGNIIYKASSTATALPSISYAKIAVVPSLNVSSYGVGVPLWPSYGINWETVDMYPIDPTKDAFPSNTSRIAAWKASSDATYVYFYFKVSKSAIGYKEGSGGYRYQSYIYTAFDTDGDPDGSVSPGAGLPVAGWEALAALYPFKGTTEGIIEFVNGDDSNGFIDNPVATHSGSKVNSFGNVAGDYAYVEARIPRSVIGCSASSLEITVNHSFAWGITGPQSFTLQ